MFVEAESGIREKEERREQIQALLADVREGDLVLVDKLDRWSRDPEFVFRTTREVNEAGASWYAIAENCDPSTREGKFMLGMRATFAQEERERIRERMVGTRRLLRDRGYYVEGIPPYGYTRQADRERKNILAPDPGAVEVVRSMFAMVDGGASLTEVAEAHGVEAWRVHSVIRSRVYRGEIQNTRGEWIRSFHEPIVDEELWQRANDALRSRRRYSEPRGETRGWVLRDVAVCARCGAKMGAAWAGPPEKRRHYYACSHKCQSRGPQVTTGAYVRVQVVEEAFAPMVVARLAELRDLLAREPARPVAVPAVVNLDAQRDKLRAKRLRLLERHADGDMSRDELRVLLDKVDADLGKLEAKAADQRSVRATPKMRTAALREVAQLAKAWTKASGERRRAIVNLLAKRVRIANGETPVPEWFSDEELAGGVKGAK